MKVEFLAWACIIRVGDQPQHSRNVGVISDKGLLVHPDEAARVTPASWNDRPPVQALGRFLCLSGLTKLALLGLPLLGTLDIQEAAGT